MIALECWWYRSQEASPCLQWKAQAVQPAPSAWGPGCPCMDSEWSNGRLCKYDKTQSSVLSVCSWDLHPGLGHSSPARVKPSKLQINTAVKGCVNALCGYHCYSHLFAGNESHEDIVTDCGGGNIRTWCIKLRVAKFLPVLKWENNIMHLTLSKVLFISKWMQLQPNSI